MFHHGVLSSVSCWQVMQPQRHSELLWELVAALEAELGCLVGCNAYITPAGGRLTMQHAAQLRCINLCA